MLPLELVDDYGFFNAVDFKCCTLPGVTLASHVSLLNKLVNLSDGSMITGKYKCDNNEIV